MTKTPARVFVLGATGHVGQAVVRHALEHGREVTAATRQTDPEGLRGLGAKIVRIDSELQSLAELAAGHDLLVDAAAPYLLNLGVQGSPEWRSRVDAAVRRTERVIAAARVRNLRLAFVSSYATVPRHDSPVEAAAALWRRSVSPYFEAKVAMEQAVIAAAGVRAVIVNPVAFLGPWEFREAERNFVPLVLARRLPMVIGQTMCVIDVRDVADAIDRAVSREFFGKPIPLAGHNILPVDLAVMTARLGGVPATPPLVVDGHAAAAAAFWGHWAFSAFGMPAPSFLGLIAISPEIMPIQQSQEQIDLGVTIRPLEETLRDAVAFHQSRQRGWF
jgi:dihydroflavonol-4-reductase